MLWLTLFTLPLFIVSCWLFLVGVVRSRYPKLRNQRICLLIAHPDDEAMFFAPTLLALTEPSLGNHVKILCLSSGDSDGQGETRKKELAKSGIALGLREENDVFIVESPEFVDSMNATWDKTEVANLLSSAFAPNLTRSLKDKSKGAPNPTIDVLITFDSGGVSSHPNHISLFHGARHFISSLVHNRPGLGCPVALYSLKSISILRKYTSFLDSIVSIAAFIAGEAQMRHPPSPLLFVSNLEQLRQAQRAMTTCHQSQMKWFRWGWIGFSRYMVVNDLCLEKPSTT